MSPEGEQANGIIEEIHESDTTKDKYLTFVIDEEEYGVEIASIKEIISICPITQVPQTIDYIKGIINLRGDVVPVIDVRKRFKKQPKIYDELTCIVVIEYHPYTIGLIVDNVREVMYIEEENILPTPSAKLDYYSHFIKNIGHIGEKVKLLMDLDKFIGDD